MGRILRSTRQSKSCVPFKIPPLKSQTEQVRTVYNLRVSEDHTYFVGKRSWGFSVWVHNAYQYLKRADGTFEVFDEAGKSLRKHVQLKAVPDGNGKWNIVVVGDEGFVVKQGAEFGDVMGTLGANATRLSPAELATKGRLEGLLKRPLKESPHVGAEYVDDLGRSYEQLGNPLASQSWNELQFLSSIDGHLRKVNDYLVIDLTGFTAEQIGIVKRHLASLPQHLRDKIIRIGF